MIQKTSEKYTLLIEIMNKDDMSMILNWSQVLIKTNRETHVSLLSVFNGTHSNKFTVVEVSMDTSKFRI